MARVIGCKPRYRRQVQKLSKSVVVVGESLGIQVLGIRRGKIKMDVHHTPAADLPTKITFEPTGSTYQLWRAGNPYEFVQTYQVMRNAFGYGLQYVNFGYWPEGETTDEAGREMSLLVGDALGLKSGSRLLEAGSGLGQAAIDLCQHYDLAQVMGMNPCTPQVRYANDLAKGYGLADKVSHQICDASKAIAELKSGSFTHGMAMECIGVFPDPDAFLRGMHQVLPSGGRMAFTVVTTPPDVSRLQEFSGKLFFGVKTYPGESWAERLTAAGFVDVRRQDITQEVFPPMLNVVRRRVQNEPEILDQIGPILRWAVRLLLNRSERGVAKNQLGYEYWWAHGLSIPLWVITIFSLQFSL